MPQLEFCNFPNLIFWCLFSFFILHFAVIRVFCLKLVSLFKERENIASNYLKQAKKNIEEAYVLQKKMIGLDYAVSNKIFILEDYYWQKFKEIIIQYNIKNILELKSRKENLKNEIILFEQSYFYFLFNNKELLNKFVYHFIF